MPTTNLRPYLEDLESRIDDAEETDLYSQWREFATGKFMGAPFAPKRPAQRPPGVAWPHVHVNDALDDLDAMVLHQLGGCSQQLAAGAGTLMCVRANYGTPILPSLFGAEIFRMAYDRDTLPASHPISRKDLDAALDHGVPDLRNGLGAKVFDAGQYYRELLSSYPKVAKHVHVYHPDIQGPMDVCEMVRGSVLFEDAYDAPEYLHSLLRLMTDTYSAFLRRWQEIVPPQSDGCAVHWGLLHRGTIMLRDDSAMNFSGAMFDEFIRPYDQRLLSQFGGGAIHFCGRGDHYIASAASMTGIYAFNMSQPHLNNMETILRETVDKGIQIIGFPRHAADALVAGGRELHGNMHLG